MRRVIGFFSLVSVPLLLASLAPGQAVPEARQVPEANPIANDRSVTVEISPAVFVPINSSRPANVSAIKGTMRRPTLGP